MSADEAKPNVSISEKVDLIMAPEHTRPNWPSLNKQTNKQKSAFHWFLRVLKVRMFQDKFHNLSKTTSESHPMLLFC